MQGRIFSIEEFATFDGPGIRTTVFLKGCPLRCVWCHNPEGQQFENEMVRSPNGCLGCNACIDYGEKLTGQRKLVPESVAVCPQNLIRQSAKDYSSTELCEKLLKNALILLKNGGGVTFSGGEPLAQYEFLTECLKLLDGRLHRALQTCGMCGQEKFKAVLKEIEYVLYDIKLMDEEEHIKYTGLSNRIILENFRTLCKSGVPFCVRIPLIPGVTDTAENITVAAAFLKEQGQTRIELMPYNKMAGGKYALAGRSYCPPFDESIQVKPYIEIFQQYGITAILL